MAEGQPLRVLVVEATWWWREAMLRVLEQHELAPVAVAGAEAARRELARRRPDVALVDLDDADGLRLLAELRAADIPCVALSGGSREHVGAALNAAASYAIKTELDPERLSQLAAMAAEGGALLVQADRRVLETLVQPGAQSGAARYGLTARELDVLGLLASGRTNDEIARAIHLAPSSVKKLVSRILFRLGVRNRVEAALVARREGLVAHGPEEHDLVR
jgi:DNA-binding NarL/FixJ family response regulator